MFDLPVSISSILPYLAPPVIGAFIGYLTNRVAIKMLFRPLRKWRIGPIPVPMTPGVIPSKRHTLAVNIGDMVGEHLLTSEEISKSLRNSDFQNHLYQLIESRLETLIKQDLGPLPSIIPQKYVSYFDIGSKSVVYQIKESINNYLHSDKFQEIVTAVCESGFETFMNTAVDDLVSQEQKNLILGVLENQAEQWINSESFEIMIKRAVAKKVSETVIRKNSLRMVLPDQVSAMVVEMAAGQAPAIAVSASDLISRPDIIKKITSALITVIEEFIENLGPMAAMVRSFLDMKVVEEKITEYLGREGNDLRKILEDEKVITEIEKVVRSKVIDLLDMPVEDLLKEFNPSEISMGCDQVSNKLIAALRQPDVLQNFSTAVREHLEVKITGGQKTVGSLLAELTDASRIEGMKYWFCDKILAAMRSQQVRDGVYQMVDLLSGRLLEKPIGKLSNFIPAGVRSGIYSSIQQLTTKMLVSEVPGIVKSLNIRKIVAERIDTFDLLRLEKLLLSIMEEQFKYINLFGGLLGFLIGCINLLVILGPK